MRGDGEHAAAQLGVVVLARHVDEARIEAAEGVAAHEEPRALTLAESVTGRLAGLAGGLVWEHYRVDANGRWAVDWDYGSRLGPDGKPVFETDWQSFRVRRSKKEVEPLTFTAERQYTQPGQYRIAARVTEVFGNDGIATVMIDVG